MVPDTFTVTFTVNEDDSTIEVKDSEGEVVGATSQGVYDLEVGSYTYTVSKDLYTTDTGSIEVVDENIELIITLELA